jgi:hypothetical protein
MFTSLECEAGETGFFTKNKFVLGAACNPSSSEEAEIGGLRFAWAKSYRRLRFSK